MQRLSSRDRFRLRHCYEQACCHGQHAIPSLAATCALRTFAHDAAKVGCPPLTQHHLVVPRPCSHVTPHFAMTTSGHATVLAQTTSPASSQDSTMTLNGPLLPPAAARVPRCSFPRTAVGITAQHRGRNPLHVAQISERPAVPARFSLLPDAPND